MQQRGECLPDGIVADYLSQLSRVDADRERMEELIAIFWTIVGREQAN
jgi:hypothetical protein